jgi:hemerythrin-like metal-binding protein
MLMKWREELITGNDEFDLLHEELFNRVQELMAEARKGNAGAHVGHFLWFLQRYIRKHFRTEEYLQRSLGYSGYKAHKDQHDQFCAQVRQVENKYATEGESTVLIVSVIHLLADWFKTHIRTYDQEAANFLREVGA